MTAQCLAVWQCRTINRYSFKIFFICNINDFNHPHIVTWEVVRIVCSLFVLTAEVRVDTVKVADTEDVPSEVCGEIVTERVDFVESSVVYIDDVATWIKPRRSITNKIN